VGDELSGEDELEPHVVREGRDDGAIVDQGDRRQWTPTGRIAEQLGRPLGIGGAAAVAECEQPSAVAEAVRHGVAREPEGIGTLLEGRRAQGAALGHLGPRRRGQVGEETTARFVGVDER
jgi:hypothetical protein